MGVITGSSMQIWDRDRWVMGQWVTFYKVRWLTLPTRVEIGRVGDIASEKSQEAILQLYFLKVHQTNSSKWQGYAQLAREIRESDYFLWRQIRFH